MDGRCKTNEMHFYDLPCPKDLLLSLGDTPVKLRITLSYFIDPITLDPFTDEHVGYRIVKRQSIYYSHAQVDHSRGQYVDGNATTNSIEGFFGIAIYCTVFV